MDERHTAYSLLPTGKALTLLALACPEAKLVAFWPPCTVLVLGYVQQDHQPCWCFLAGLAAGMLLGCGQVGGKLVARCNTFIGGQQVGGLMEHIHQLATVHGPLPSASANL